MYPRNPIKLHLNEHLSLRLAAELRRYGFDVTSTHLLRMLNSVSAEELKNQVRWLNEFR